VLWIFICYVTPHKNTGTFFCKNNISKELCNTRLPAKYSSREFVKIYRWAVFVYFKTHFFTTKLIVISKLYEILLALPD